MPIIFNKLLINMKKLRLLDFNRYIIRKPVFSFNTLFDEDGKTKDLKELIIFFFYSKFVKINLYKIE